jgi:hypothetical protein
MRYPQTFRPSVSPTPCQCNRTIPNQGRRYPAARNLIRGRPSISVRQQTGNRNEWPISGRPTLSGNGEDGRNPIKSASCRPAAQSPHAAIAGAGRANISLRDPRGPPRFLRANQKCNGPHDRIVESHGAASTHRALPAHGPCGNNSFLIRTEEVRRTTGITEGCRMLLAGALTEPIIDPAIEVHRHTRAPARATLPTNNASASCCGGQGSHFRGRSQFRCSIRAP